MPLWILLVVAGFQQTFMAGTFVFARYVLLQTDPFAVAFLRYTLAAAILYVIASRMSKRPGARPIAREDRKKIVILGMVIIVFNQTLYLYGQKLTTAGHAALLFAITPIFVYVMAIPHLGEKWSYTKGIGIMLAVVGSAVIIFETGLQFDYQMLAGDSIIVVAVVAWAYYSVWGKPLVEKYGAFRVTAYSLASGTILYFPFGLYRLIAADMSKVDTYGWLSILYIAIITSVIGYSIWYWLLKHMEASKASVLVNIQPIVAGILGYYLLGETISLPFVFGGIIILTGVTVTQQAGRFARKRPRRMAEPL
jgi:drug/metabolite transporter (DMT)-like permease